VPDAVDAVIARALATYPGDRFETTEALARALDDAIADRAARMNASVVPPVVRPRGRRAAGMLAGGIVVVGIAALAALAALASVDGRRAAPRGPAVSPPRAARRPRAPRWPCCPSGTWDAPTTSTSPTASPTRSRRGWPACPASA
jgi:hypothetical protein